MKSILLDQVNQTLFQKLKSVLIIMEGIVKSILSGINLLCSLVILTFLIALAPQNTMYAEDNLPVFEDYVFLTGWGGEGKQILEPADVAVGPDGKIYIANREFNRITIIDKNGYIFNEIGGFGRGDGGFEFPSGVAVNGEGEIYVTDNWNRRIQKFDSQGNHLLTWGEFGSEPGQFFGPTGIAFDSGGNVYIVDSGNHRIQKFTSNGEFLETFGTQGSGESQFDRPLDVAINSNGEIYVTDSENFRIQKFSSNGEYILTIQIEDTTTIEDFIRPYGVAITQNDQVIITGNNMVYVCDKVGNINESWGGKGDAIGQFDYVTGVDVDEKGIIYVADGDNNRIQMFDLSGNFLNVYGVDQKTPGYFYFPQGISIVENYIYVAEGYNNRIQKFNQDGTFIMSWGEYGVADGKFNFPSGVAADSFGIIYVVDTYNHRIQKFDQDGKFLSSWGGEGIDNGLFDSPIGIAIDHHNNIFIVDTGNNRIQKFDQNGFFIKTWGALGSDDGQFSNPRDIAVDSNGYVFVSDFIGRVQKFDNDGNFIKKWKLNYDSSLPPYYGWIQGIAIDLNNNIYLSGMYLQEIQKFTNDGAFIGSIGSEGNGPGEFGYGAKLAINESGILYASDIENQRIQVFSPFPKEVDPDSGLVINGGFESIVDVKIDVDDHAQSSSEEVVDQKGLISLELPELNKWTYGGSLPIAISENAQQGNTALQLGGVVDQVPQGVGEVWAYQVVYIKPEWVLPELTFQYNVVTNDHIELSDFFVEIQDGVGLNHLATVVRDGYESETKYALPGSGTDLGWKTVTYDLSAFRGKTIRLSFSNRNLWPNSNGIWTYLDDVKLTDETERVFLPLINR